MDKRIADAEKKVHNFYFLAKKNLTRAAKKWLNVKKLNINKQVKNMKNKESTEANKINEQLECVKSLKPVTLAESALLRLQIFEINNTSSNDKNNSSSNNIDVNSNNNNNNNNNNGNNKNNTTTTTITDEDNSKYKKDIVKKWLNSKLFQSESKGLIDTRRKRNKELRHLKERLGRKDRRKDYNEIKKTLPPKKSKALPSQQQMFMEASTAMLNNNDQKKKPRRKNRLGQRERKRRAEAKEREDAILNKRMKPNRKERREMEKKGLLKPKNKKEIQEEDREMSKTKQVEESKELSEHHPSWHAKRKKELEQKNAKFSGKKVTFDDDSDDGDAYDSSDSD